ncbi:MAG: hypothetical protein LBH21_07475, partial [Gracilibacteraceae bacterium]|nr:hypothetical protein [Gracilibacteraceae bacterium]
MAIMFASLLILAGCGGAPAAEEPHPPSPPPEDVPVETPPSPPAPEVQLNPVLTPAEAGNVENQDRIVALVNKNSRLTADYAPDDLVYVEIPFSFSERVEKRMLRREAAEALAGLVAAAQAEGLSI